MPGLSNHEQLHLCGLSSIRSTQGIGRCMACAALGDASACSGALLNLHSSLIYNPLVLQTCSMKCVYSVILLSCTCHICCMSARAGRQIPPLWLFLKFFSLFLPCYRGYILFLPESRGLGAEDVIHEHIVLPIEAM